MIAPNDLLERIIRPTLGILGIADHQADEELLLGTAMQESGLGAHLAQLKGPALGIWQMEPASANDIWENYLKFRKQMAANVSSLMLPSIDRSAQLAGNLYYACAMARIEYLRAPEPLPPAGDVAAQADFYLRFYNRGGKATADEYIANWTAVKGAL